MHIPYARTYRIGGPYAHRYLHHGVQGHARMCTFVYVHRGALCPLGVIILPEAAADRTKQLGKSEQRRQVCDCIPFVL